MKKFLLTMFVGIGLLSTTVFSQLLITEDFTGYTHASLVGSGSWSEPTGTVFPSVTDTGTTLTYPSYNGGGGEYCYWAGGTTGTARVIKTFTPSTFASGNVYYMSFLMSLKAVYTQGTAAQYSWTLSDASGSSSFLSPKVFARSSGAGYNFGVAKQTTNVATGISWGANVYNLGQTYLVVVKYVMNNLGTTSPNNTDDACYLWVNPALTSEPLVGSAECTNIGTLTNPNTVDVDFDNYGTVSIGALAWNNRGTTEAGGKIDGIRAAVGTSSANAWAYLAARANAPALTYAGALSSFSQTSASASAEQSYTISGVFLTNNVEVIPPAGFEISKTSGSGFIGSTDSLVFTAASLSTPQTIYVRLHGATLGGYSGNITHQSADFVSVTRPVVGTYTTIYYSAAGSLDNLSNWWTNPDGSTGSNPGGWNAGYVYEVVGTGTRTPAATWTIADISTGSKVVVGDGTNAVTVSVPNLIGIVGTIDANANGTIDWADSTHAPAFGNLNAASTVVYSQNAIITIPISPLTYGNLTLKNGNKFFPAPAVGSFTIAGNLLFDGATKCNGGGSPFTTINLAGNYTFANGANFDTSNGNRMTMVLNGTSTQTLNGGGNELIFFRLTVANTSGAVLTDGTSNLTVCNLSGGGITLSTGNLTVNNNKVTFYGGKGLISNGTGTFTCGANAEFVFNNIASSTIVPFGTLSLTSGAQTIKNLTLNLTTTTAGAKILTLGSPITVTNGLFLTSGILKDTLGNNLTLGASATITGASASSYVNGPLSRTVAASGVSSVVFPIGRFYPSNAYRPITLGVTHSSATSTVYTAEQIEGSHSAATLPGSLDSLTTVRYVTIAKGSGATVTAANLLINYGADQSVTDAAQLRIAQKDSGSTWSDVGGQGTAVTTGTITSTVNFTTFGDFILGKFSGRTLYMTGILDGFYNVTTGVMNTDVAMVVLHNTTPPYANVDSSTVTLNHAGVGAFGFRTAANGTPYYLAVKHRNTIQTWSAASQSFTNNVLSYDFTSAATQAYGSNMKSEAGKYCFWGGDVNQDSVINLSDMVAVDNDNSHTATGYRNTDVNGDLVINLSDMIIVDNSNSKSIRLHDPVAAKIIETGLPTVPNVSKRKVTGKSAQ